MYVPVLKNRTVEVGVLKDLFTIIDTENTIPMIEVIQDKVQSNSKYDFFDILEDITNREDSDKKFFVEVSKENAPTNILESVRTFLTTVNRDPEYYLTLFMNLKECNGMIPVISYNPDWLEPGLITKHASVLREKYQKISIKVTPNMFNLIKEELQEVVNDGDYILLDIGYSQHTNPILKRIYNNINQLKDRKNIKTIIINSTKGDDVTNVSLNNGEPIYEIDNSLRDLFKTSYSFDGFGDYAGVSDSLPTSGGGISPAGIFYSKELNCFVGFRRNKTLSDFEDFIAPEIMKSEYWKEYSDFHHNNCPGCKEIKRIVNEVDKKKKKGKSQAKWKGITMSHYIFSIDEWLSENS